MIQELEKTMKQPKKDLIAFGRQIFSSYFNQINQIKFPPFLDLIVSYSFIFYITKSFEMLFSSLALFALGSAGLINGASLGSNQAYRGNEGTKVLDIRQNNQKVDKTALASNALQTASEKTGQEAGTDGIVAGQAPSAT